MKRWLPWIGAAVLIQALVVIAATRQSTPVVSTWQAIAPIPADRLPHIDGVARHGRPAVFYFWATWCEPCVRAWPETLATAHALAGELDVWLVSRDTAWSAVAAHFGGDVPAQVLFDRDGRLGDALGVRTLPTSFFVAANGSVVAHGDLSDLEGLRKLIEHNQ